LLTRSREGREEIHGKEGPTGFQNAPLCVFAKGFAESRQLVHFPRHFIWRKKPIARHIKWRDNYCAPFKQMPERKFAP
jgi:hypothetical protein